MTETERGELTTKQAGALAGVSDAHIRRLLIDKTLQGRKVGGWFWLVDRRSLERWIERRKQ